MALLVVPIAAYYILLAAPSTAELEILIEDITMRAGLIDSNKL